MFTNCSRFVCIFSIALGLSVPCHGQTTDAIETIESIETRLNQLQPVGVTQRALASGSGTQAPLDALTSYLIRLETTIGSLEQSRAVDDSSMADIRKRITVLEQELDTVVETTRAQATSASETIPAEALIPELRTLVVELKKSLTAPPKSTIALKGDIRYRHEVIDEAQKVSRNRSRLRVRIGINGTVTKNVNADIQLASGMTDSPISTNQDLGDSFSAKPIWISIGSITWKPPSLSGSSVSLGKMKNPFYSPNKNQFMWDSDLTPEGFSFNYSHSGKTVGFFANTAAFWIEERSTLNDSWLLGGQTGFQISPGPLALTAGVGFFTFTEAKGHPTFYDPSKSFGNTTGATGLYSSSFHEVETSIEVGATLRGLPILAFGDMVNNTGAEKDNQGFIAGLTLGTCSAPGTWSLGYDYRRLEKDATVAALNESDFINGGTDSKGHKVSLAWQVTTTVQPALTYFLCTKGLDNGIAFHRLELDINYRF